MRASPPAPASGRRPIEGLDPEALRYTRERVLVERLRGWEPFDALAARVLEGFEGPRVRRELIATSLRLTESMSPSAHRLAAEAAATLGLAGSIEIYQSSGPENAGMHHHREPILIEIQGRLLTLLDEPSMLSVLGHELGHYLAHGPDAELGRLGLAARVLERRGQLPEELAAVVSPLTIAGELTADRFGMLAVQDLDAALRAEMATTTGLSTESLTWDTEAYLAQCTELMEACLRGEDQAALGATHPEHSLRAYARWLFSETREYRAWTGKGPGTRSLAEVDATLDAILALPELDLSYAPLEDPPPELHECALAASVLIATADEELSDVEVETLERTFAPLVSGWEAYLDVEHARARFRQTAPVIRAAGPELLRPLCALLTHVMAADGEVDEREVSVVLGIGRYLEAGPLFERWLIATLNTLGVSLRLVDVVPAPIPLPARRDDVLEALDSFIDGVERRGGGKISARRLLHLIGHRARQPEAIETLEGALASRGVTVAPPLASVALDELVTLTPTPRDEAPDAPPTPAIDDARQVLLAGLTRLRDQLISGDGRSPSVRLRATRPGRSFDLVELERVSVGLAERALTQVKGGRVARLVDPSESGTHRAAESCVSALLALDRTHRDRLEETGSNDLFLGYPFLSGAVGQGTAVAGYPVRAPLVLYPVDLVRDGRGARGFRLAPRKDEAPTVNHSLLRLIFNKKRFAFPDALAEELDGIAADASAGPEALLAKLRELGLDLQRSPSALAAFDERDELGTHALLLHVEEQAVLGLFPQSSSDLLQDYDALLQELRDPAADLDASLAAARLLLPAELRGTAPAPSDERALHPLIFADPTQREVLDQCRQEPGMVVDGPPGTGKSQVIVNLVLDAVRRGERVAVVCEKRAALDVVHQRVASLGLTHALALVHDVNEDRRALYDQIARRIDEFSPLSVDEALTRETEAQHEAARGALEARMRLLSAPVPGATLSVGQLYTLRSSVRGEALPDSSLGARSQAELLELIQLAERLHPLRALWAPGAPLRSPAGVPSRRSTADLDAGGREAIVARLGAAEAAAQAYEEALGGREVAPEALADARTLFAADREARQLRASPEGARAYRAALAVRDEAQLGARLEAARGSVEEAANALALFEAPVHFPSSPELERAIEVASRWSGRFFRFFVFGWWAARKVLTRALEASWSTERGARIDSALLERLRARLAASRAWSATREALGALGAPELLPASSDALAARLSAATRLVAHGARLRRATGTLSALGLEPPLHAELSEWDASVDTRFAWADALGALEETLAPLRAYFPWLAQAPKAAELGALRRRFEADSARLVQADALLDRVGRLHPSLLAVLDALAAKEALSVEATRQALLHAWASAKLVQLEREVASAAQLGTPEDDLGIEDAAARLEQLERERSELEVERVNARLDAAPFLNITPAEKHKRRTRAQAASEELSKEVRKKRRVMALRTFVRKFAAEGLLDVLPVWLLSPETMTILFPREPLFDLVVVDEASQCTVESGLPVLLRAKRVVIAGDEKQMPPTSFFQQGSGGDDEGDDDTERAKSARDLLSGESLLTLARTRMRHAGLAWHYRCHHESLIAFSNHAMYGGELRTIPSTRSRSAEDPLKWIAVPDGHYDSGLNEPEARRVVNLIDELLADEDPPTLGVVTFNLKQRRTILDAIDRRVSEDAAFAERWSAATERERIDERPFVKNLEAVQGDERDVIIFSLGHAPATRRSKRGLEERYVPARFGPLGLRGGERRLNVAISRAKRGTYIVASFEPTLLSAGQAQNRGPRLLRDYLEFAHATGHGQRAQAERVLDRVRETSSHRKGGERELPLPDYLPLHAQLALALEALGLPYELDVGASSFRVPVAIFDPHDPERYALALLLDEGASASSPLEAFVHRPAVLRTRGWRVMHVNAATWARRPESVLEAICEAVPGARGALDSELWRAHRARLVLPSAAAPTPAGPAAVSEELPTWAASVTDARFRRALVRLAEAGTLRAEELSAIVGGPRRARLFEAELEGLRASLPFEVIESAGGYRTRALAPA